MSNTTHTSPLALNHSVLWQVGFVLLALAVLYVPTFIDLFTHLWLKPEQMHGPLVLIIAIWLMVRNWPNMLAQAKLRGHTTGGASVLAWVLILLALGLYFVGRTQNIILFELGSLIVLLIGLIWLNFGGRALKAQWFALFFMFFMIPLPSVVVDTLTMPMKLLVSFSVENLLLWFDYPIARKGVVLQIGPYMLLVADACAGLHTLLTLEALGLLYLNLVQRNSLFRNVTLAILIVPISLLANIIRVLFLTLITYHFGDAAGQSYLHNLAGIVLFLSALLIIIFADTLVHAIQRKRH